MKLKIIMIRSKNGITVTVRVISDLGQILAAHVSLAEALAAGKSPGRVVSFLCN